MKTWLGVLALAVASFLILLVSERATLAVRSLVVICLWSYAAISVAKDGDRRIDALRDYVRSHGRLPD